MEYKLRLPGQSNGKGMSLFDVSEIHKLALEIAHQVLTSLPDKSETQDIDYEEVKPLELPEKE